jgi:hypothetical protein
MTFDVDAVIAQSVWLPAPVVGTSTVEPVLTLMSAVSPEVVTVLPPK